MAEPVLLEDLKIYLGGFDLTDTLNSVEIAAAKAELANSRFGDTVETMFPGLQQISAQLAGFWDSAIDKELGNTRIIGSAADWPLSMAPPSSPGASPGAEGNLSYVIIGNQFQYTLGSAHGELLPYSFRTLPSTTYQLHRHKISIAKTALTATKTGTSFQLGALSATQELVIAFHAFSITGGAGSWDVNVESDDAEVMASPTSRASKNAAFTDTNVPTTLILRVSGPVTDDWWRTTISEMAGATTLTVAATFGIADV